ncbi:hypothetical protein ILUMI_21484 [Ignelater luminosus]|uniref:EGF-like domain-containing protein n=1 Tax=Ignelater luminosus TaxID=2038154 RepID=A0A8K0CG69_IGNLU|nr:hypothetical protein ILUMI_21484 [Ignelater luminosus]
MRITDIHFCMAMFVAMCKRCTLKFEVLYSRTPYTDILQILEVIEVKPKKPITWQEVKLTKRLPSVPSYVQLFVTTKCPSNECKFPFWAIDDFELCSQNEIRTLTITQKAEEASCQVIKYENQQIRQTSVKNSTIQEISCPAGTFGTRCIECSTVLGITKRNCDNSVICSIGSKQSSICKCAAGYQPPLCEAGKHGKYKIY